MLILGLAVAAVSLLLTGLAIWQNGMRKQMKLDHVVHLPFFLAMVGMICGNIMAIPTVICAINGSGGTIAFSIFTIGCHSLTIAYLNCVIWYDEKGFAARNFLGIRRQCTFAEVEGLRTGKDQWLYFQGHRILLDEMAIGSKKFISMVKKGYSAAHDGRMLMETANFGRRKDPMNGNIQNPWLYFCIWIGMMLLCGGMVVFGVFSMMAMPASIEELSFHQMSFTDWNKEDDELRLTVPGREEAVRIFAYRGYGDLLPSPEELCSGETFTVGLDGHYIESLTGADGTVYITPELVWQNYHKTQDIFLAIMMVLFIAGIVFSAVGIDVARHPERYGRKFKRAFYQDYLWQ